MIRMCNLPFGALVLESVIAFFTSSPSSGSVLPHSSRSFWTCQPSSMRPRCFDSEGVQTASSRRCWYSHRFSTATRLQGHLPSLLRQCCCVDLTHYFFGQSFGIVFLLFFLAIASSFCPVIFWLQCNLYFGSVLLITGRFTVSRFSFGSASASPYTASSNSW